jgi:hypothetical protein
MGKMAKGLAIHALIIEFPPRSDGGRDALVLSRDEQLAWLKGAAERGASLVVLVTDDAIELYSTERDRKLAFRAALQGLAARVKDLPGLAKARTVAKYGADAARHLMRRAGGRSLDLKGALRFVTQLHAATALSAYSAALGANVGALFRAAVTVSRRVRKETALGDASATGALRELERLSADRIVEEELAAWQAQEVEFSRGFEHAEIAEPRPRTSVPVPAGVSSIGGFRALLAGFADEPGSMVRAKLTTPLANTGG